MMDDGGVCTCSWHMSVRVFSVVSGGFLTSRQISRVWQLKGNPFYMIGFECCTVEYSTRRTMEMCVPQMLAE